MKAATKYKIISILCLGIILISYNQCMNSMEGKNKSKLKTQNKLTSTSPATTTGASAAQIRSISIDAFSKTVYPITRARCVACHGMGQTPLHASSSVETAYDSLINTSKVDFNNIPNSRLVLKLRSDRHNCWGDCSINADQMQAQIIEWKQLIDEKAPDATESTTKLPGKTSKESITVHNLLSPSSQLSTGTISLMAESGSLKSPMVKGIDNGTSYVWVPEGVGTKTMTSTDAGVLSLNATVNDSDFYKIYMLVNAPDDNSDSAFIKIGNYESKEWQIRKTSGFEWREVTQTNSNQTFPAYIAEGSFKIEIKQRDDGLKISKITITNDPTYTPTTMALLKATISVPISDISGVNDSVLNVDIEEYDIYSYKLTNPRIVSSQDIYVKNLKVLVNGSFNPQHSTYTVVNKKITPTDGNLSNYSMIVLKDKGLDDDRISFNFEHIGTNSPSANNTTIPPVVTTPPTVTKLTSVAGFQQSLWPVLKARCMGCHGNVQPPLHSHADAAIAHTNVTESSLVNFTNIANSKISNKLRVNKHNCWSDCNANANELEGQITIWKNLSGK